MLAPRRMALLAATALVVVGCQTAGPPPKALATDQTLRIAIPSDISAIEPLDPPQIGDALTYAIGNNVFGGLYRYDDGLRVHPDGGRKAASPSRRGGVKKSVKNSGARMTRFRWV